MARTIVMDANVFDEINRGNQDAAKALDRMLSNGDTVYVATEAYKEMVTDPAIPRAAKANELFLSDTKINRAPAVNSQTRLDVISKNQPRDNFAVLGEKDVHVAAEAAANNAEIWSLDRAFRNNGESVSKTLGVKVAPECRLSVVGNARPADYRVGRNLMKLPPVNIDLNGRVTGSGSGGGSGSTTISPEGLLPDQEASQTKALGVALAAGVIVGWLDDYCINRDMKKDVKEWEDYILKRRNLDPEQGFLLVAIIKVFQPRDAVYETKSYVSMEMVEDYTLWNAEARASQTILPGLIPPTETVWYTYQKRWIPPLQPRPTLTADQKDEKLYGRQPWYPRYQLVRHSLEDPADYGEALGALQGSSMFDILRVLDALPPAQYNALKSNLYVVKGAGNQSRFRIAFAAVEDHKSSSSFGSGQFLQTYAGNYAALGNDFERNCVKDWVDSGEGAISNTLQGRWEVVWNNIYFEYSFYLSGKAIWRDRNNLGAIGGQGTWTVAADAVRVQWPQTGTIEQFNLPLDVNREMATAQMKTGSFPMTARKINPYP
jgi:hypothetical protein